MIKSALKIYNVTLIEQPRIHLHYHHYHEYLTREETLHQQEQMIIQEGKFTYSSFGKEFGKQRKTIED